MPSNRRQICTGLLAAPAVLSWPRAWAQDRRPNTMVVPYTPGGSTDIFGRMLSDELGVQSGDKINVENRPGANGTLGAAYVSSAPPDGHTLLYAYGNLLLNQQYLMKDAHFNVLEALTPVSRSCIIQAVLVAAPSFPARDLREFIAMAKRAPMKHSYAYYGDLGLAALAGEAGIELLRVPYKGGVPGMVDVMGGRIDVMTNSLAQAQPMLQTGKLKALAVYGDERLPSLPNVPTVKEVLPGYRAFDYQVVFAPRNTPRSVVAPLAQRIAAALNKPELKARFLEKGAVASPMQGDELRAFLERDQADIARIIKAAGIQPE